MTKHDADSQALAVTEKAHALVARPDDGNPILATLNAIVAGGVSTENVAALEKVCGLYERMEALGARKAFAVAKAALQAELPSVMATKGIPSKDGTIRSTFAPYEEIMAVVGPFLVKHGFSVSFTMRPENNRMAAVLTLMHIGGHSETNEFSVRVGSGPPGCSEAQSDGAARSYARRGALCDALNIVIDHDTDARLEGATITPEQAKGLRDRVRATGTDEVAFLKLAGADTFEAIRESKVPVLERAIAGKQKAAPAPTAPVERRPVDDGAHLQVLKRIEKKLLAAGNSMTAEAFLGKIAKAETGAPEVQWADDLDRIVAALKAGAYDWATGEKLPAQGKE